VLITGVSGYVGSQVCSYFLKDGGYTVRGTVRDKDNEARIAPLKEAFGDDFKNLELRNAELLDTESLDKAIEGADYVVHTASPFHFKTTKLEELLAVAVDGTLNTLKAAAKHKCKRVVITSSRAAISFGYTPENTPKVWNDSHWSDADFLTEKGLAVAGGYMLSKTLAERAAWDYQKSLGEEAFELVSINPCLVVGPAFVAGGFQSGDTLESWMHGKAAVGKEKRTLVDVRAVAQAHLNAIKIPEARNQRFMLINGNFWMKDFMTSLAKEFPDWPIKTEEEGDEVAYQEWDTKLS